MTVEFNGTTTVSYNELDANNNAASPNGWLTGVTTPNQVEPINRTTLGALQRAWNRANGGLTVGGTANAITLTPSNTAFPTSYVKGELYQFKATAANTGTTTLNINGLGNVNVFVRGSSGVVACSGGEIQSGDNVLVSYDGTQFQLLSQVAGGTLTASSTATFTNKTYDTAGTGNSFKINGTSITSISGNTAKVATTTGSLTSGHLASFDGSGNIQDGGAPLFTKSFTSSDQAITTAGTATIAHGLAAVPTLIQTFLVCQSSENGFTTGDIAPVYTNSAGPNGAFSGIAFKIDATNITLVYASTGPYVLANLSNGVAVTLTNANWKLRIKAWV